MKKLKWKVSVVQQKEETWDKPCGGRSVLSPELNTALVQSNHQLEAFFSLINVLAYPRKYPHQVRTEPIRPLAKYIYLMYFASIAKGIPQQKCFVLIKHCYSNSKTASMLWYMFLRWINRTSRKQLFAKQLNYCYTTQWLQKMVVWSKNRSKNDTNVWSNGYFSHA